MQAILIEDEAALRLATQQTLELGGFTVQAVASAEAAQPLLRADYSGVSCGARWGIARHCRDGPRRCGNGGGGHAHRRL
jgi:hypothetical protein